MPLVIKGNLKIVMAMLEDDIGSEVDEDIVIHLCMRFSPHGTSN